MRRHRESRLRRGGGGKTRRLPIAFSATVLTRVWPLITSKSLLAAGASDIGTIARFPGATVSSTDDLAESSATLLSANPARTKQKSAQNGPFSKTQVRVRNRSRGNVQGPAIAQGVSQLFQARKISAASFRPVCTKLVYRLHRSNGLTNTVCPVRSRHDTTHGHIPTLLRGAQAIKNRS